MDEMKEIGKKKEEEMKEERRGNERNMKRKRWRKYGEEGNKIID